MFVYNESENSSLAWTYLKGCVQITVVEFSKDSRYQAVQNSLKLNFWIEKKKRWLDELCQSCGTVHYHTDTCLTWITYHKGIFTGPSIAPEWVRVQVNVSVLSTARMVLVPELSHSKIPWVLAWHYNVPCKCTSSFCETMQLQTWCPTSVLVWQTEKAILERWDGNNCISLAKLNDRICSMNVA